jgi:MurNAc alpha-1-phosphate uridylyltransferase
MVKALPLLTGDPILIVNSDNIWTDGPQDSIQNLARHWDGDRMDALLLVIRQASATGHGGRGDFHMDGDGRLSRRKPGRVAPFVYTGIQLVSRRLLADAPEGPFSTNILWDRAIAAGRLYGLSHMGQWFDVGTPASIAPTEAALGEV